MPLRGCATIAHLCAPLRLPPPLPFPPPRLPVPRPVQQCHRGAGLRRGRRGPRRERLHLLADPRGLPGARRGRDKPGRGAEEQRRAVQARPQQHAGGVLWVQGWWRQGGGGRGRGLAVPPRPRGSVRTPIGVRKHLSAVSAESSAARPVSAESSAARPTPSLSCRRSTPLVNPPIPQDWPRGRHRAGGGAQGQLRAGNPQHELHPDGWVESGPVWGAKAWAPASCKGSQPPTRGAPACCRRPHPA
jgi:hypothetical protein